MSSVFPVAVIFRQLYAAAYKEALANCREANNASAEVILKALLAEMEVLHGRLVDGGTTSALMHLEALRAAALHTHQSNTVCLCCHLRKPEHPMDCGHAMCQTCVRTFGRIVTTGIAPTDSWRLPSCPICGTRLIMPIRIKPPTAGIRVLSVDGGGVKGIVPLQLLFRLQELAGLDCPMQHLFDLVYGTSIGKW